MATLTKEQIKSILDYTNSKNRDNNPYDEDQIVNFSNIELKTDDLKGLIRVFEESKDHTFSVVEVVLISKGIYDPEKDTYTDVLKSDYPEVYNWFEEVYC